MKEHKAVARFRFRGDDASSDATASVRVRIYLPLDFKLCM